MFVFLIENTETVMKILPVAITDVKRQLLYAKVDKKQFSFLQFKAYYKALYRLCIFKRFFICIGVSKFTEPTS